jgi:hypothetical protein
MSYPRWSSKICEMSPSSWANYVTWLAHKKLHKQIHMKYHLSHSEGSTHTNEVLRYIPQIHKFGYNKLPTTRTWSSISKPNCQTKGWDPNCQSQNELLLLPRHFHHQCTINCMKHQASLFHIGQWQGVSDLPLLGSCMHNIGLAKKAKQNVLENCKYIHAFYIW